MMLTLVTALSVSLSGLVFLSAVMQLGTALKPNRFWVGVAMLFAPWLPLVLLGHYLMWDAAVREMVRVTPFKT